MAVGLMAAAILVAVVFPGATEATITGSLLVAFGFGWAVMGWATTLFTTQPLRWTRVPAVAMAATGIALFVVTPQDAALRTLSWIWPVPAAALAVYIWVHASRTVPRRGLWMVTPIAAFLALAAVGATYENISVVRDQHTYAAPGIEGGHGGELVGAGAVDQHQAGDLVGVLGLVDVTAPALAGAVVGAHQVWMSAWSGADAHAGSPRPRSADVHRAALPPA